MGLLSLGFRFKLEETSDWFKAKRLDFGDPIDLKLLILSISAKDLEFL